MRKSPAVGDASAWLHQLLKEHRRPGYSDAQIIVASGVRRASFYRLKAGIGGADNETLAKLAAYFGVPAPRVEERFVIGESKAQPTVLGLLASAEQAIAAARAQLAEARRPTPTRIASADEIAEAAAAAVPSRRKTPGETPELSAPLPPPAAQGGRARKERHS